jgi:signal transduction histidine kinase/putative methionine-R-sulfoxide reductase with GAF domain
MTELARHLAAAELDSDAAAADRDAAAAELARDAAAAELARVSAGAELACDAAGAGPVRGGAGGTRRGSGQPASAGASQSWAEQELLRLNRALRVLSACNRAVSATCDEADLLQQVCRIVVDVGGYPTVWVGFAEHDYARTVRPVAHAGGIGGYLEELKVTWADEARGRGPTGTAIRTRRPVACQQIQTDPNFLPWRETALAEGYRAAAALPLMVEGKAIGALSVCAVEADAFDRHELELLQQTASDLAQGIALCRADAQRRKADEALRQAERVAREHATLITKALESLRHAPTADAFVRDALGTIVARLGACGGALWMAGEGLHDTRVVIDYDLKQFRSGEELGDDHPGKKPQPFPMELVERWRRHDAEPAILDPQLQGGGALQCSHFRAWAARLGIRSVLLVPLIFGDDVLGALAVRFTARRNCTPDELRLAKALAQQATLVLKLSHLSRQARESAVIEERERVARERATRLESANAALQRTLSHLVNAQDSVALLDHIMREAAGQMQASMTGVYLYDEASDTLRLASCVSENEVVDLGRDERFVVWRTAAPAAVVQTWRTIMRSEQYAWFSTGADRNAPSYLLNWHRAMGHQSLLAVPLKLGDRALGFVGMFFGHERLPDEERLELARVFGQQAALAAQMADLAERAKQAAVSDERLAQLVRTNEALTHTLDRLATESSLDTALGDMLVAISQHLGAPSSTLWLHDADNACGRLHLVYDRGRVVPGARSGHPSATEPLPIDHGKPLFKRLFDGVVSIIDPFAEDGVDPLICAHLREQGIQAVLVIPMRAGGVLLGSCMVRLSNVAGAPPEQIEFARILVQQATLLLEVTRLAEAGQQAALSRERERIATEKAAELQAINEALRRAEQLARAHTSVITNTLQSITREPTLDSFIGQVLKTIVEQLGGVGGTFWQPSVVPNTLVVRLTYEDGKLERADPLNQQDGWQLPMCSEAKAAVGECEPVVLGQAWAECGPGAAAVRDWVRNQGCGSALHVPLVIGTQILGACTVRFARPRDFVPEELTLARALALQATLALQLARLEEQGRRSAVLDERNRMARDIHDTLAQGFTGVVIQLEAAKDANARHRPLEANAHIQRASELARQSLAEARRSVHALRPLALEQGSLGAAIEGLLHRMTAGTGIDASLEVRGRPWDLPAQWEDDLLHIGQEAVANALKHAGPKRLRVTIEFGEGAVTLTISDDGSGFEASRSAAGFGLSGMRERVERLGGRLALRSAPGDGTAVVVALEEAADTDRRRAAGARR